MIRLALAAALLASPAFAQAPAALEPAFSGTIVSTYPDGRTGKLWLERDGTYRGQGRRGRFSSGRWTVKGERICFRQTRPTAIPLSHCTPLPKAGAGASWTGKAVTGEPIRIQLVPGR